MQSTGRLVAGTVTAMVMAMGSAGVAHATSDSEYTTFPNGQRLTSNIWIQSFTWTGCGDWKSSSVMAVSPNWIKNKTDFYQVGLGACPSKTSES